MIFNTYYALIGGVFFMSVFFYLTSQIGLARGWKAAHQILTMMLGVSGIVLFIIWPIASEPFMLDNSNSFAAGRAFGDSIFVRLSSQSDDIVVMVKGQDGTVSRGSKIVEGWPTNLAQSVDAQGILHSKYVSAIGIHIGYEWRFVDAEEYDNLFREKAVRIRENTIDRSINVR